MRKAKKILAWLILSVFAIILGLGIFGVILNEICISYTQEDMYEYGRLAIIYLLFAWSIDIVRGKNPVSVKINKNKQQ